MCEIQLNSVRIIAVSIICLGFLLFLLPEDWDHCLPQLRSMLYNREEPQESTRDKHSETLHIRPREAKNCNSKTTPSVHWLVFHSSQKLPTGIILLSSTFTRQFRCTAHDQTEYNWLVWGKLLEIYKEGAIDQKIILCKALGFDWLTC